MVPSPFRNREKLQDAKSGEHGGIENMIFDYLFFHNCGFLGLAGPG